MSRGPPTDHDRKTLIIASTDNARLEELLVLFGCRDEIAPLDADALAKRAGELIATVSSPRHPEAEMTIPKSLCARLNLSNSVPPRDPNNNNDEDEEDEEDEDEDEDAEREPAVIREPEQDE
jgi:hypothetical protein